MRKTAVATLLAALLFGAFPGAAGAQIVPPEPPPCPTPCPFPEGPVVVEDYRLEVVIDSQVATTRVIQVLRNEGRGVAETEFLHPLPPGAAVTGLTLWIDGEPVEGEVLDADEARSVYRRIVSEIRDPALLEFVDHGLVRASLFPIPGGGERRIELTYTQILEADQGLAGYRHPLGTELGGRTAPEHLSASIEIISPVPIQSVYSPTHDVAIERDGRNRATVGYETGGEIPDGHLSLYYSVGDGEIGLQVVSFRDPEADDPAGFFLLLASPGIAGDPDRVVSKDVILVIDRSGSMEGEKLRQARDAAGFVLENLNDGDRFAVISFSTGVDAYRDRLLPADAAAGAADWVQRLSAAGSTDIDRALSAAFDVAGVERPTYVLFLTDGLPTEGEIDTDVILRNAGRRASDNTRLFAFGVGYDVDTLLLDGLADRHSGTTSYVTPGEEIDTAVSSLYRKLSNPVLTGLEIDFGEATVYDLYPDPLPDLFSGEQLVLVGRYRAGAETDLEVHGRVGDEIRTFAYEDREFLEAGGADTIPRLWATRKIGDLLRTIRLEGPDEETIDQIVSLSIRFGIVTPYTSFLVTDDAPFGAAEQERLSDEAYEQAGSTIAPTSGEEAVEYSDAAGQLLEAEAPAAGSEYRDLVRVAGSRTFRWSGGAWIDTAFDPDTMEPVAVPFLSDGYFALAGADPGLADALAVGERVVVIWRGTAYRVVDGETAPGTIDPPPASTTTEVIPPGTSTSTTGPAPEASAAPGDGGEGTPWSPVTAGLVTLGGGLAAVVVLLRKRRA